MLWSRVVGWGVGLLLGVAGVLAFSASASAETVAFKYTGKQQEFVVPAGVSELHVEAIGAPGGNSSGGALGGVGAVVTGDLKVSAGTLYVEVGGTDGGFNGGGGPGPNGGGGGGASDVRTVSIGKEPSPGGEASLKSRLLVAAGGGGGGTESYEGGCAGGAGGNAESAGEPGSSCGGYTGGGGGGAGGTSEGGKGGQSYSGTDADPERSDGGTGTLGAGGGGRDEVFFGGGGGGGGLYGGGGGGVNNSGIPEPTSFGGSGGGGGGSNLVPEGGEAGLDENEAEPSVTITYTVVKPPEATIEAPANGTIFTPGEGWEARFSCTEGEGGSGLYSCVDSFGDGLIEEGGLGRSSSASSDEYTAGEPGEYEYTVTAKSHDGLEGKASIKYTVANQLKTGTTSCNGIYTGTGRSVQVPAGATCTLLPGTKVSGSVQAQSKGSTLIDEGAVIGGTVQLDGAKALQLYGGGSIGGNLIVEGLTGAPAKGDDELCDTSVHGNIQVLKNTVNAPLDIGDEGSCEGAAALTIGGYLQVQGNAAPITVAGNTIGRYLLVYANKAKLTINANTVGTTIHVYDNTKGTGSTLTANSSGEACTLQGDNPPITGTANTTKAGHSDTCDRDA